MKECEIEMKLNQAHETVTLPSPSRPATQVYTEPCLKKTMSRPTIN